MINKQNIFIWAEQNSTHIKTQYIKPWLDILKQGQVADLPRMGQGAMEIKANLQAQENTFFPKLEQPFC